MRQYILKRLAAAIPSLFLCTVIIFSLGRLIPGDVVELMLQDNAYAKDLDELRTKLGLDQPIHVQYWVWLSQIVRGDLGQSLWTGRAVTEELVYRLPVTLELGATGLLFALVIGIPVGVVSAIRQDTARDYAARTAAILGLSVPGFWLATLAIVLPAIYWGWSPPIRFTPYSEDPWAHAAQFLLPGFILGLASAAAIMRLTRAQLLEVLRQDYVRTAWAKGLAERVVVLKHSLRNAIIPVVTVLGIQVLQVLSATVILETIFGLPGMSSFLFEAIQQRDYPTMQGVVLVIVSIVVTVNLLVDMLYTLLDPRIRY